MDLWVIYVLSLITVCVIRYYETHWCDLLTMDKVAMSVYLTFQTHRQTMSRVACVHVVDHIDSPAVAFPMNSLSRMYGRIESLYPPALPFQSNASPLSTAFTGGSNQRVMPDLSSVLAMRMNTRACVRVEPPDKGCWQAIVTSVRVVTCVGSSWSDGTDPNSSSWAQFEKQQGQEEGTVIDRRRPGRAVGIQFRWIL